MLNKKGISLPEKILTRNALSIQSMKFLATIIITASALLASCTESQKSTPSESAHYIGICNGHFDNHGTHYYYIGTNIDNELTRNTDSTLICRQLDQLAQLGISNIRIEASSIDPTQLDKLLSGIGARQMKAVICLSDARSNLTDEKIKDILERTNTISGTPYMADTTIMAWQICSEPAAITGNDDKFVEWIQNTAALIKSIDNNHLVSTGIGGISECHNDAQLYYDIHSDNNIDYLTMHIWPADWRQATEGIDRINERTLSYAEEHLAMAQRLSKPIVIDAFGLPANDAISTGMRDQYLAFVFDMLAEQTAARGELAGCNFWKWCGNAQHGQYCISVQDSTANIIRKAAAQIAACM